MSNELDFLDDLIVSEKPKGRVAGKFQPKLRPKNAKAPPVPSQPSKDAMQISVLPSQTSKDAEQPPIPFQSSNEAMQPIPVAPESHGSCTNVSLRLDEKTLQPCEAASSSPADSDHHVTHEHVDQPDASVSESLPLKDCITESVHHDHEKSVQEKDVDMLFNLDDSEGLRTPGSVSADGCERPKGISSSKDKAQEKLYLNEKSATHLEDSEDTIYDHEGSKKLQSDHHELEGMAVWNDSDMGSCGRLSHPGGATGFKEGKADFASSNLGPAGGSKSSSEFNVLQGSLSGLEVSADGEPFHSANKEAGADNDQATNMFFNMESLGNGMDDELNSGVDQSVKDTYLTNVSADENQPSRLDDSYPSSCVNEKISVPFDDEDVMVFSGFQSANEISMDTTADTEMDKSHYEYMPLREKKKGKSVSFILPDASEPASLVGSFSENTEPCFSDMMTDACIEQPLHSSSLDGKRDHQMDHLVLEEEMSENVGLENFDGDVSKQNTKTGKFRPKSRTRINKTKSNASAVNTGSMDLSSQQDSRIGAPECSDVHSSDTTKENPINSSISFEEELVFEIQLRDVQERNQGTEEVTTAPELGESTRILRKRAEKSSSCAEVATDDWESIFEMDEVQNDDDYQDEDKPKKGRGQKKSMPKTSESEKPTRTRKRTVEEPDSTAEKPPKKKLPHGTQRKRRQVSKTLLEKPEEEINPRQLPIKDLILLAEAKERMGNKSGGLFGNSFSGQSNNSFFNDDEANFFGEDEEQNYENDEGTYKIQETKKKLNYHSYMNRPRTTRWSKSETNLLYQAISEFGTNFAMIEQLFPNRTRHQVKLKFKNEERKNPLLIHDALNSRSKDHSLFNQVIEQMQINKEQNSNQDTQDPISTSQDASNENEEEQAEPHKDKGEDVQEQQVEVNVTKDEPDNSTNLNEDENVFIWDDDGTFPEDVEKKDSWEF